MELGIGTSIPSEEFGAELGVKLSVSVGISTGGSAGKSADGFSGSCTEGPSGRSVGSSAGTNTGTGRSSESSAGISSGISAGRLRFAGLITGSPAGRSLGSSAGNTTGTGNSSESSCPAPYRACPAPGLEPGMGPRLVPWRSPRSSWTDCHLDWEPGSSSPSSSYTHSSCRHCDTVGHGDQARALGHMPCEGLTDGA